MVSIIRFEGTRVSQAAPLLNPKTTENPALIRLAQPHQRPVADVFFQARPKVYPNEADRKENNRLAQKLFREKRLKYINWLEDEYQRQYNQSPLKLKPVAPPKGKQARLRKGEQGLILSQSNPVTKDRVKKGQGKSKTDHQVSNSETSSPTSTLNTAAQKELAEQIRKAKVRKAQIEFRERRDLYIERLEAALGIQHADNGHEAKYTIPQRSGPHNDFPSGLAFIPGPSFSPPEMAMPAIEHRPNPGFHISNWFALPPPEIPPQGCFQPDGVSQLPPNFVWPEMDLPSQMPHWANQSAYQENPFAYLFQDNGGLNALVPDTFGPSYPDVNWENSLEPQGMAGLANAGQADGPQFWDPLDFNQPEQFSPFEFIPGMNHFAQAAENRNTGYVRPDEVAAQDMPSPISAFFHRFMSRKNSHEEAEFNP